MAGTAWNDYAADFGGVGFDNNDQTVIFPTADQPVGQPKFDVPFEATVSCLYWTLLVWQGGYAGYHVYKGTAPRLKRWPLYFMTVTHVLMSCISESIAWGYSAAAAKGHATDSVYLAYVFFWHASTASFLVLLLALSSGYCITHGSLDGLKARVFGIPAVVMVAGVASDFTFVYVESSQALSAAADRYNIVQMSAAEEAVWFLGSLANIMCFILAWIYVFDSTQLEVRALDDAQAALQRPARRVQQEEEARLTAARNEREVDSDQDDNEEDERGALNGGGRGRGGRGGGGGKRLGTVSQRTGLLYGMESAGGRDVESNEEHETLADRMEYTVRKTLLTRFYYGVCAYLVASMLVILLPAFFNNVVQNVIVVLQFVVKFVFTLVLAWLFRPAENSPYLQLGTNEGDNDDDAHLDTELVVTDVASRPPQAPRTLTAAAPAAPASTAAATSSRLGAPAAAVQRQNSQGNKPGAGDGLAASVSAPSLPVSTITGVAPRVGRVGRGGYATLAGNPDAGSKAGPKFTLEDE